MLMGAKTVIIEDIGREAHVLGGMDAVRCCFCMLVIKVGSILNDKNNSALVRQYQDQIHHLENYVEGIGQWKAYLLLSI